MLPNIKASTKNVLIVAGKNGTKRYMYVNSVDLHPNDALRAAAKEAGKMVVKGYERTADWAHDLYRSYKLKRMMKKAKKTVAQLRAAVHL